MAHTARTGHPGTARTRQVLRQLAIGICAVGVVLCTSGCLEGDVDVTVRDDRSGSVAVEVLADEQLQQVLGGADLDQLVTGAFAGLDGVELESIERDGQPGYRLFVPFDDYREFSDVLTAGAQVGGQQVTLFSSFRLTELNQGGWKLEATINPASAILTGGGPTSDQDVVDELLAAGGLGEPGGGLELTVSLPGKVDTSNATRVDGGSATWRLDAAGAPTDLQMTTEPTPGVSPVLLIVLGAISLMVLGVLMGMSATGRRYRRRRSGRARRARRRSVTAPSADAWAPRAGASAASSGASGTATAPELPALSEVEASPPVAPTDPTDPGEPTPS